MFDLDVELPYTFMIEWISKFTGIKSNMFIFLASKKLVQVAWSLANDSFRCPVCVLYRPQDIAAASFYMASRLLQEGLGNAPFWESLKKENRVIEGNEVLG